MEREELDAALRDYSERPAFEKRLTILAEFDRLTVRVAELAADLWDTNAALDEAQSWLDKIRKAYEADQRGSPRGCTGWAIRDYLDSQKPSEKPEPLSYHGTITGVRHDGDLKDCPTCNPPRPDGHVHTPDEGIADGETGHFEGYLHTTEDETPSLSNRLKFHTKNHNGKFIHCPICNPPKPIPHTTQGWKDCPNPPKYPCGECEYWQEHGNCGHCSFAPPKGKPKCEHKNLGPLALGGTQRCLDCHEWIIAKPLTQCPECIWGQKRREFTAVEGAYCKYVIYERCPRCRGEGRIPC